MQHYHARACAGNEGGTPVNKSRNKNCIPYSGGLEPALPCTPLMQTARAPSRRDFLPDLHRERARASKLQPVGNQWATTHRRCSRVAQRPKQQFQSGILISGFYWNHVCDFILKRAARHEVLSKYFYSGGVIIFEVLPYDRMVQLAANLTKTRAIKPPVQNLRTGAARAATGPCARRTAGIPPCSRPPSASRGRRSRSPSHGRCRHLDGPYL